MSRIQSSVHVLLVEDDDAHAELIELALMEGDVDHPFTRASSGEIALQLLLGPSPEAPRFDCIFLDMKLRRMSGIDVLEQVRTSELDHVRNIPVIMLTTSVHVKDLDRAYTHHANSFIKKPLQFEAPQEVIKDLQRYWCLHNVKRPQRSDI